MATFGDLKAYVEADGWTQEPILIRQRARAGDHWRCTKRLPDGRLLRTKISHALHQEIGADLFHHILRDQLGIDQATFWVVVRGLGRAPDLPTTKPLPIPAWLVQRLLFTVGLPEEAVARMTPDEALAAWNAYRVQRQP